MNKVIIFFTLLVIALVVIQASIYFWTQVKRRRDKEDRLEIQNQKRAALIEFKESQETLEEFINERYKVHD